MMFWSSLVLAAREIRRNLFRSSLTVLGVVIGVAAVIVIVTIGNGATAMITDSFSSLGARLLIVSSGREGGGPHGGGGPRGGGPPGFGDLDSPKPFQMEDVEAVRKISGVHLIAPLTMRPMFMQLGDIQSPLPVTGVTGDYFAVRSMEFESGGWEQSDEDQLGCVIANQVAERLFETTDAVGKELLLDGVPYTVSGVLKAEERGMFGPLNQTSSIFVPIELLHQMPGQEGRVDAMFIDVASTDLVDQVRDSIKKLLRDRREIPEGKRPDFRVHGLESIVNMIEQTTGTLTAVISSIAGISLFVGGIGIMNVMLVTVTERTREIGVRMAIGAQGREVLFQFLVESSMLTAFGGILGISLGLAGGGVATTLLEIPFRPSVWVVLGVFLFSVVLGIVFGFLPARRAARLNPIDALRHE